ncbi:hypothetical protein N7468_007918 [Penicillium chermesinum]|uniref:Uncharacterized protein n=1 Tax=Penicillium chermesinum TaxID=63820 RepID=A0A9W9NP28_9EURO|nr:uncharacterized protein N7468_007918 [Penicillium chermesinum]KAJ5223376.1 hypothetical protein N7468_007918 [Penicillium chermesinum]KAJ6155785.1 hypothetical protein N7470_006351 [Penicillium chermesinum]
MAVIWFVSGVVLGRWTPALLLFGLSNNILLSWLARSHFFILGTWVRPTRQRENRNRQFGVIRPGPGSIVVLPHIIQPCRGSHDTALEHEANCQEDVVAMWRKADLDYGASTVPALKLQGNALNATETAEKQSSRRLHDTSLKEK